VVLGRHLARRPITASFISSFIPPLDRWIARAPRPKARGKKSLRFFFGFAVATNLKIGASTMLSRTAACIAARRGLIISSSSLAKHGGSQRIRTLSVVSIGAAAPQSPSLFSPTVVDLSSSESATSRFFSSKPQRKRNKNNGAIMNEQLIRVLMRRYDAPAGELNVRLVIDEGPTQPSSIEVVSLLQAMETARDLDVDLIGINLNQDPPVVKAQDYTKLAYKASNKKQTKSNKRPTKEFNFRVSDFMCRVNLC
jgi:hypothetical protein